MPSSDTLFNTPLDPTIEVLTAPASIKVPTMAIKPRNAIRSESGPARGPLLAEPGPHALREGGHLLLELPAVGGEKLADEVLDADGRQLADLLDEIGG